jgi:hypothetical protein
MKKNKIPKLQDSPIEKTITQNFDMQTKIAKDIKEKSDWRKWIKIYQMRDLEYIEKRKKILNSMKKGSNKIFHKSDKLLVITNI